MLLTRNPHLILSGWPSQPLHLLSKLGRDPEHQFLMDSSCICQSAFLSLWAALTIQGRSVNKPSMSRLLLHRSVMRRFGIRCPWIPFAKCPVFNQVPLKCFKTPCLLKHTLQFGFYGGLVDGHEWIHFHFQLNFFYRFLLSVWAFF